MTSDFWWDHLKIQNNKLFLLENLLEIYNYFLYFVLIDLKSENKVSNEFLTVLINHFSNYGNKFKLDVGKN
jgi:hypothetical protein